MLEQEKKAIELFAKYADSNNLYSSIPGLMRKLGEEQGELVQATMEYNAEKAGEEAADMIILLFDIINKMGSKKGILRHVDEKLKVLEDRWSKKGQIGRNRP